MSSKALRTINQILITQLLSVIFAIVAEIQQRFFITNDWVFSNILLLSIILLTILYAILINLLLEGKWVNVILIFIPYIIYYFFIFIKGSEIFPMHTDPNNYGIGIMGLFISICQWISVLIASILGTYLKIKRCKLVIK